MDYQIDAPERFVTRASAFTMQDFDDPEINVLPILGIGQRSDLEDAPLRIETPQSLEIPSHQRVAAIRASHHDGDPNRTQDLPPTRRLRTSAEYC